MGRATETLEDLLRPGLQVMCVGINPAPKSVAAGHYYQGRLGQRFWSRLRTVGLLPQQVEGWEDDAAFACGVGFTDIVKRPTASAKDVGAVEFEYGRELLLDKLDMCAPQVVVFVFKQAATKLLGSFPANGFIGRSVAGADVFVMPGPMESAGTATRTLGMLRARVARARR